MLFALKHYQGKLIFYSVKLNTNENYLKFPIFEVEYGG